MPYGIPDRVSPLREEIPRNAEQYDRLAKVFAPRMERDRFSESTISNIYYDTPDFRLIRRSLDRPAYKEKLRLRTYRTPHARHRGLRRDQEKIRPHRLQAPHRA
ncbi:MAG: VTC domain-containing protein [Butyricicoccaceae bacterium]